VEFELSEVGHQPCLGVAEMPETNGIPDRYFSISLTGV
jgi:hypothetical protein